jgi:hypothetical protein
VGEKGNYNQVSFANTYANAIIYIYLNETKFIKEYQNKISKWSQCWKEKCIDLTWHDDREVVFRKINVKNKNHSNNIKIV